MASLQTLMKKTAGNFFGDPVIMASCMVQEQIYLREKEATQGVVYGIA